MPASTRRCPPEAARRTPPLRGFRDDVRGVTEVIGYLLVFGILSMILVLSMLAFNIAKDAAVDRAVELRAESAAARVAGVVVQAAVLAEQEGTNAPVILYNVQLTDQLEGKDYTVILEPRTATTPDRIRVFVPSMDLSVTAPLFSASAPASITLCNSSTSGGDMQVVFDVAPAGCGLGGAKGIFLQVTP